MTISVAEKKKYKYIIPAIFILAVCLGILLSDLQHQPISEYPDQLSPLNDADFVIAGTDPALRVGASSLDEVQLQFFGGKMLGRSGVYRPAGLDALFTFTRKTNILNKLDITGPGIETARGVAVNDSFDKVVKNYGDGYVRSYVKSDPQTFDAIYGEEQCIVFNVKDNVVKKIVILHEIDTAK